MQLVEQGKLQLDQPMGKRAARTRVAAGARGIRCQTGEPKLRPAKRPITLRHLLTHTAGFTYDIWNADTADT